VAVRLGFAGDDLEGASAVGSPLGAEKEVAIAYAACQADDRSYM
jgi:hypothetical protein